MLIFINLLAVLANGAISGMHIHNRSYGWAGFQIGLTLVCLIQFAVAVVKG